MERTKRTSNRLKLSTLCVPAALSLGTLPLLAASAQAQAQDRAQPVAANEIAATEKVVKVDDFEDGRLNWTTCASPQRSEPLSIQSNPATQRSKAVQRIVTVGEHLQRLTLYGLI